MKTLIVTLLTTIILVGCSFTESVKCPENRIESKEFLSMWRKGCGTKEVQISASGWIPKSQKWSHTDIMVYFYKMTDDMANQQDVKDWIYAASQWESRTNFRFFITDDPEKSDIRVSFKCKGNWSYVGASNENILKDRPTMNFEWRDIPYKEAIGIAKHEIGHAIGLGHEHSHPDINIQWNRTKTYDYYGNTQGWTKEQVDQNVFNTYKGDIVNSGYDRYSIMHYPIDPNLTLNGVGTDWNYDITEKDFAVVNEMYPRWASKYNKEKTRLSDYNSRKTF